MPAHDYAGNCTAGKGGRSARCRAHPSNLRGQCHECPLCEGCEERGEAGADRAEKENRKLDAEIRKLESATRLQDLRERREKGELVSRVRAAREHAALAHAVRERFRALPERVADELLNLTERYEAVEVLRRYVEEALNVLARTPTLEAPEPPTLGGEEDEELDA